jgi:hypothetical protein
MTRLAFAVLALAPATAFAGAQDFTLQNDSGMVIDVLNVSPVSQDTWGEDILGVDTLAVGASTEIAFSGYSECKWDVQITQFGDGSKWYVRDLDLCGITKLTFGWDGSQVTYTETKVGE